MKKLRITVEGKAYDVTVEVLDEGAAAAAPAPVAAPVAAGAVALLAASGVECSGVGLAVAGMTLLLEPRNTKPTAAVTPQSMASTPMTMPKPVKMSSSCPDM